MDYKNKYLKYKNKYFQLKQKIDLKQKGGQFISIPSIGLGTWQHNPNSFDISETIYQAIIIGYRCFDCAFNYDNEEKIGKGFKKAFDEGIVTRDDLFIIGKATNIRQFNISLERLGIEKFNLALCHIYNEPRNFQMMIELKNQGKTDDIGVSNIYINKLRKLLEFCEEHGIEKPVAIEDEINFFDPEIELVDFCTSSNIKIIGYTPLGQKIGLDILMVDDYLKELTTKYEITIAQLLLIWLIRRGICPIPSSTNPDRLRENLISVELSKNPSILTPDEIQQINSKGIGYPIVSTAQQAKESDY